MSDLNKIAKLHQQEREAERENNDFIDAHNTMMKRPDKYKIDYFPVNGEDSGKCVRRRLGLETQCEMEYELYKRKKSGPRTAI